MIQPVSRLLRTAILVLMFICMTGQLVLTSANGYPGVHLVSQRWHYMFSDRSPLANPSFINEENYITGRFVYASTLSEYSIFEVGAVYPLGLYQSLGATIIAQNDPSLQETDNNGNEINPGVLLNSNKKYIMLTYANNIWKGLTLGMNLNMALNSIFNESSIGITGDIGLSYKLLNSPLLGTYILGVNLQNVLSIMDQIPPTTLRVTLNSSHAENRFETGFDWALKDIGSSPANWAKGVDGGKDSIPQMSWELNVKAGFTLLKMFKIYGLMTVTDESVEGMGMAAGANLPFIMNGRDLCFLAQFLHVNDEASTISLYARMNAGKHREEIYARKMAKMIGLKPNDLYTKAVDLYQQKNYWDAFFLFSQLFVEFPDFFKNDWVSFFLGSCQENLDMRETAEEAFNKTKQMYPRSAAVPFADLGLMRIQYRNDNKAGVEKEFNELNKLGVPDSIKFHGYYIMGETELNKKNYSKAKQLFALIPETHPDYAFAQHSSAVADAMNDNYEGAVSSLESAIQAPATTPAQKEIVNRSYIFLGYLFYEVLADQEGSLAKAVTAMRSVPKTSMYYPDALLGLGWTALKARQWADCKNAGAELVNAAQSPVLKAEGLLLQAYANSMNKDYASAVDMLQTALKGLEGYKVPEQADLASQEDEYNSVRSKYTEVAKKAYDLGTSVQSEYVKNQIDSLATFQKNYLKQINEHLTQVDQFQRAVFFSRNIATVKEDVEYALAKFTKANGKGETDKKTEKIDDELEKLKKQLEETGGGSGSPQ